MAFVIAKYLHILALIVAGGATALAHFSIARYRRSATVAEAKAWHAFGAKVGRAFPLVVLTLVATGGFMVSELGGGAWRLGWVQGGLVGAVLLMVFGAVGGVRDKRVVAELQRISGRAAPLPWDPVVGVMMMVSPCLAWAVAFAMVAKLAFVPSLATLAVGIVAGAVLGMARERATAALTTQVEG